ncbi:MAG TPA: glutamate--tRNA ligase [Candidatus Nanoarchaeia archaeon]|nr:glutamate--tRNA ligase [Candidatus Nanoarchaeia archaeon]
MKEIKEVGYKFALQNAVKYGGKANPGAVVGKVLAEDPELKEKRAEVGKIVAEIIYKINRMSLNDQVEELKKIAPELLEEREREESPRLKPLKDAVKGRVVMRVAPSPSGPLHVGHAYVLGLSSEFCKMYKGKLILRIEDTNPENIYPPAYEMIPEDANWLTKNGVDEVVIQSDRMKGYYDHAHSLLEKGHCYVCVCDAEKFRGLVMKSEACPCRVNSVEENLKLWDKMFVELKPGEAVVRVKTELHDPNPALREWPALRINEHSHPRRGTEFRVWPLMNFSVAVDDHLLGVTHSVRGKDHIDNEKKQRYIFKYLGWRPPVALYVGRINFEGFDLSTSETRRKIEYGEYEGWDDIRLPFLGAFRRRGYRPEAFVNFALDMGVHEADKTLPQEEFLKILNHHNKELIDREARRFFIVVDPVEVEIENAPSKRVRLKVHPDFPERGERIFETSNAFYVQRDDVNRLEEGKVHRLMECCNFEKKNGFRFVSGEYEEFKNAANKGRIIHYVPYQKEYVRVEILMPDKKVFCGIGEPGLASVKVGEVIQAERLGFMRLDAVEKEMFKFWFCHR